MKKVLIISMLCPLWSLAQNSLPKYENDTLYTSSGYKIYKGQLLQLAKGSSAAGYFRFIKFHSNMARTDTYILQNSTIEVEKLKNFKYSGPDNQNIRLTGTVTYENKSQGAIDILMDFDKVTQNIDGLPAELTVPAAFKTETAKAVKVDAKKDAAPVEIKKQKVPDEYKKQMVADEIKKLFDLYKAGALTKEEFEAQKKKLLEWQ